MWNLTKRHTRNPPNLLRTFNCYNVAKYFVLILCVGLVLLVYLDWLFISEARAARSTSLEAGNRIIPQMVRGTLLGLMTLYIIITGLDPGQYGFKAGRVVAVFAGYMFVSIIVFSSNIMGDMYIFAKTLVWIVGAIAFYRLSLSGYLTTKHIELTSMAIIIVAVFYTIMFCLSSGSRVGQNANAYLLVWCLPLILIKGPSFKALFFVALAAVGVIITIKRGAILVFGVSLCVYFLIYIKLFPKSYILRKSIPGIITIVIVIFCMVFWQWENILYRLEDVSDLASIGSGRGTFWRYIVSEWYNSNLLNMIFGLGFFTVESTTGKYMESIYAHSDWLEILHDFGLVGIAIFIVLHVKIIKTLQQAIHLRKPIAPSLGMGYCAFLMINVYSLCTIGYSDTIFFSLLLGYSSASLQMSQKMLKQ